MADTSATPAPQPPPGAGFCCGPCSKGNHDACMATQPCDCPGCR